MKTVQINGTEYPFRVTMGAMLRFKRVHGMDLGELAPTDVEGLLKFIWCCICSASSVDGREFALSFEEFADRITPETFEALCAELNGDGQKKTTTAE